MKPRRLSRKEDVYRGEVQSFEHARAEKRSRHLENRGIATGRVRLDDLFEPPLSILDAGSDEPRCWWVPFDAVADNDYNLTASRYKPRVVEAAPDEDPAELIREVLAIEREITAGLEKLLDEVE